MFFRQTPHKHCTSRINSDKTLTLKADLPKKAEILKTYLKLFLFCGKQSVLDNETIKLLLKFGLPTEYFSPLFNFFEVPAVFDALSEMYANKKIISIFKLSQSYMQFLALLVYKVYLNIAW